MYLVQFSSFNTHIEIIEYVIRNIQVYLQASQKQNKEDTRK